MSASTQKKSELRGKKGKKIDKIIINKLDFCRVLQLRNNKITTANKKKKKGRAAEGIRLLLFAPISLKKKRCCGRRCSSFLVSSFFVEFSNKNGFEDANGAQLAKKKKKKKKPRQKEPNQKPTSPHPNDNDPTRADTNDNNNSTQVKRKRPEKKKKQKFRTGQLTSAFFLFTPPLRDRSAL